MKINKEYVSHMITLAEVAGIFQPVRFALNGPSQQYVLSTEQAKMIRERAHFLLEVQVPSNKASLEYFIAKQTAYQNVLKNGGMDVAQLAKALGKKESTAKDLICRGEKAELLHPVRAQGRSYALLAKEIEELISGEIKVPVKKRVRYMTARQIAEKSGISIKSVLRRIKAGELLGYFHPSKKGTHKLPLEEATIIINGTLDLPWKKISEAKTVEEAENYAKQYQKVKELENSGGMRTEQIAQKLGILPTTLATKIQTGVKLGVINPYRTRDHAYLLHPQEAEMIISGKLQLPELRVIKRREAKQTILTARRQDIRNLDLNIVPYTAERELIQKAVHGDNIAMRILKEIYKEEIKDAAKSAYVHSSSYLDRRQMSEVAFYEVLCEADTRKVRADLPELLQEKMKERNKEETATWGPKLESPLKGSPGRTLHDKIAETTITNGFY